jgi:hypothetical protein
MKAIKRTNLKMLTVLAAVVLSTASLAIPMQESRAEDEGGNTKGDEGIEQINKCSGDATCINIYCQAETCIIPPLNDPFKLPF